VLLKKKSLKRGGEIYMTNFKKQFVSVIAAGSLLVSVASPVLAETTIQVTGNGADSTNWTTVSQSNTTSVSQNNTANVTNNVDADANTGGNDAKFNTGGDVSVDTGDATTDVSVTNALNSNSADVAGCNCAGDTNVTISGNGADSENGVVLGSSNTTSVSQNNDARVRNNIDTDASTGYNDANSNTGGDVSIKTGDAKASATVSTLANVNSAHVGGGLGSSNPSASFVISGNGAGSDNAIVAELLNSTTLSQNNRANISNDVDADAKTGDNDAKFNTGGDVTIDTGDATTDVDVSNAVNFNHADVDCGCLLDVLAKVHGNGADSENLITLGLDNLQAIAQDNEACLFNDVDGDAKTGHNDANSNTGGVDSDPSVHTGDATNNVDVNNSGNVNTVGNFGFDWPEVPGVDFSFNFAALWAFFGMHS
jgi:hypothetical protein